VAQRLGQLAQKMNRRSQIGAEILVLAKTFQRDLAPKNGANAPKNERGVTACSQIGTEILILAKTFQEGRVPNFGTNVPKNERGVTSGLYGLLGSFPGIRKQGESRAKNPSSGTPNYFTNAWKRSSILQVKHFGKRLDGCLPGKEPDDAVLFFMRDSALSLMIMFLIATDLAGNTNTNSNKYIRLLTTAKRYGIIE